MINRVLQHQHFYMTYELSFGVFYPTALLSVITALLFHHPTMDSLIKITIATVSFPAIRGLMCVLLMDAEWQMILMGGYGPLYISALLPCKIHALVNIMNFEWGTTARANGFLNDKVSSLLVSVIVFNILLAWCIFTTAF